MQPDLFYTILAMYSYNRGYGTGVTLRSSASIGNATVITDALGPVMPSGEAEAADFYAIAYNLYGQTVIAYRGSDYVDSNGISLYSRDIWQGWSNAVGFPFGGQP